MYVICTNILSTFNTSHYSHPLLHLLVLPPPPPPLPLPPPPPPSSFQPHSSYYRNSHPSQIFLKLPLFHYSQILNFSPDSDHDFLLPLLWIVGFPMSYLALRIHQGFVDVYQDLLVLRLILVLRLMLSLFFQPLL